MEKLRHDVLIHLISLGRPSLILSSVLNETELNRRYNEVWYVGKGGGAIMVSFQFFMPFSARDGKRRGCLTMMDK